MPQKVIVKTYKASRTKLTRIPSDAGVMAAQGYFPVLQTWAPGSWGCGAFVVEPIGHHPCWNTRLHLYAHRQTARHVT